jgi:hypothetical protein
MKYVSLLSSKTNTDNKDDLASLCKSGHSIGPVIIADGYLFVKKGFRYYYISYRDAEKIFRRVRKLHANICCGDGDIEVEYLVIYAQGRELMEVTLPGKKAARALIDELKGKADYLDTSAPVKNNDPDSEAE